MRRPRTGRGRCGRTGRPGNSSSSVGMRQVCGGDLSTSRRGSRTLDRLAGTSRNVRFHFAPARGGRPSRSSVGVERGVVRETRSSGRATGAEEGQGELVLLRPAPARRHVVHIRRRRAAPVEVPPDEPLGQQEVARVEALVGVGIPVPGVLDEQLVQQRRAAAPVAEDEDRRLRRTASRESAAPYRPSWA